MKMMVNRIWNRTTRNMEMKKMIQMISRESNSISDMLLIVLDVYVNSFHFD
jgi:hypothetical protein